VINDERHLHQHVLIDERRQLMANGDTSRSARRLSVHSYRVTLESHLRAMHSWAHRFGPVIGFEELERLHAEAHSAHEGAEVPSEP